jgi:hypothetical protein
MYLFSLPTHHPWLVVVMIMTAILLVVTLVGVVRSSMLTTTGKLLWALVILLFPFWGAVLYLLLGRKRLSI